MKTVTVKALNDISDTTLGVKGYVYFKKGEVFNVQVDGNGYQASDKNGKGIWLTRSEVVRVDEFTLFSQNEQMRKALESIAYSMVQAQVLGNDYWREIRLSEGIAKETLAKLNQ